MTTRLLIPLADHDFDVTEVVVPWDVMRRAGVEVTFATEQGQPGACDPRLLTGVIFGQLGAKAENVALYRALERDPAFLAPIRYDAITPEDFDALVLPGGHAPGMRQYLESTTLQRHIAAFMALDKPVGAICHGTIALARALDPDTGRSVIEKRRLTCLPAFMELSAFWLTAWKLGRYYRTYPATVAEEVQAAMADPASQYLRGPLSTSYDRPFVVTDGNLITARWPGDARLFAETLLDALPHRRPAP